MIIEALVGIIIDLLEGIAGLLPTSPAPPDFVAIVSSSFGQIGWAFGFISEWFPMDDLGWALTIMFGWIVVVHGFRLAAWLLAFIHAGGTDA